MEVKQFFNYIVITIITGTKFPRVHIHLLQPNLLRLKYNWLSHGLEFEGALKWPGTILIDENGEVTIEFQKEIPCDWKFSYTPVVDSLKVPFRLPYYWDAVIEDNSLENNDTCVLTAKFVDKVYFSFGAGTYVNIQKEMRGEVKIRYYFLVPKQPIVTLTDPNPFIGTKHPTINNITFMVKSSRGGLNKFLFDTVPGDSIKIIGEDGNFNLEMATNRTTVYLIASGIGIAPMTSIALRLLQVTADTKVHVVYFNFMKDKIIFQNYFERLKELDKRINVTLSLAYPTKGWPGPIGFLTRRFLDKHCGVRFYMEVRRTVYFVVAGAFHFILKTTKTLTEYLGYPANSVYRYLGK